MKASDKSAALTSELPGMPRAVRRGRPPKADAMTDAERSRKFRKARKTMKIGDKMAATISRFAREFDLTETEVIQHLLRFALCNRNWTQTGFPSRHGNSDQ